MAFRLPSIFKTPRHKQFAFKPRYYDERSERLHDLTAAAENGTEKTEAAKARIHELYRNRKKSTAGDPGIFMNTRLLLIAAALLILTYIIFR